MTASGGQAGPGRIPGGVRFAAGLLLPLLLLLLLAAPACGRKGPPVPPAQDTPSVAGPAGLPQGEAPGAAPGIPGPPPGGGRAEGTPATPAPPGGPGERPARSPGAAAESVPPTAPAVIPPSAPVGEIPAPAGEVPPASPAEARPATPGAGLSPSPAPADAGIRAADAAAAAKAGEAPPAEAAVPPEAPAPPAPKEGEKAAKTGKAAAAEALRKLIAARPFPLVTPPDAPVWARAGEEVVYKVTFLGATMGYARFTSAGLVRIGEREAYRVSIRAWTSGVLSTLYTVNETVDYYMDAKTLLPLRRESRGRKGKRDDVALFDQAKGTMTYYYLDNGEFRKSHTAAPHFFDGVTAGYLFRERGVGDPSFACTIFGGRKVYRMTAPVEGSERVKVEAGEFETDRVRPVFMQDGKPVKRGDLIAWVTKDPRRVPVRVYAKFKKVREWTLVGELVSDRPAGAAPRESAGR